MKEKARANLKATRTLIEKDLVDPAMNRLYYALFQAGVHAMGTLGKHPSDFGTAENWEHATICGNATIFRDRSFKDYHLFQTARGLREQADYRPTPVPKSRVKELIPRVTSFVDEFCS